MKTARGRRPGIKQGPNKEYANVNREIDSAARSLTCFIKAKGFSAKPIHPSKRTDPENLKGDFPHKTAATLAGLGWIGKNCQLITKKHGPWIRLETAFTDFPQACDNRGMESLLMGTETGAVTGKPVTKSFCGDCRRCVDACPAGALSGNPWRPGIARNVIFDAQRCDRFGFLWA